MKPVIDCLVATPSSRTQQNLVESIGNMVLGMGTKQEKSNQNFHPSRKRELKLSGGLIFWRKNNSSRKEFVSQQLDREGESKIGDASFGRVTLR